jgi:hypothetical protein
MKTIIKAAALAAALGFAGGALAQPSDAQGARGNAPVKAAHTVDDGGPKSGANSFTQHQARHHIIHAGYGAVSHLQKGDDGVWRGVAVKSGHRVGVALDFKGKVSETTVAN